MRGHFHSYSVANQFLIALPCPDATRGGFKAWLKLGYCVRRGETGIRIWAPVPPSKSRLQAWREAGADPRERPRTFFRLAAVFDRAQVDPLPDFPGEPAVLDPPIVPVDGDDLAHLFDPLRELAADIDRVPRHIEHAVVRALRSLPRARLSARRDDTATHLIFPRRLVAGPAARRSGCSPPPDRGTSRLARR
ncbi:ArdC family protein [Conexibacter sp. CPCC 206217]|uniref:ArdC family protein n=1 Tax=Conexibacter sp. CPCC 206217 TaxID=3064574 RepID=UPI00271FC231|nr:ArdC family protein [Conexibacter sp. CPCC 206217]MDO8211969.1 ArdC family protein [Conexibacter sp. CPCC 206217]